MGKKMLKALMKGGVPPQPVLVGFVEQPVPVQVAVPYPAPPPQPYYPPQQNYENIALLVEGCSLRNLNTIQLTFCLLRAYYSLDIAKKRNLWKKDIDKTDSDFSKLMLGMIVFVLAIKFMCPTRRMNQVLTKISNTSLDDIIYLSYMNMFCSFLIFYLKVGCESGWMRSVVSRTWLILHLTVHVLMANNTV